MGPNSAQLDTNTFAVGYGPGDNNTLPKWSGFINIVNGTQLADQQCKRFPVLGAQYVSLSTLAVEPPA